MNSIDLENLLIDYAEGIATPEQKLEVEALLRKSHETQIDLMLIQTALSVLQSVPEEKLPEHYFTNFLPHLRNKIDEKESFKFNFIPQWAQFFVTPVMSVMLMVSLISLYQVMKPEQYIPPLYSIVKEMEVTELNDALHNIGNFDNDTPLAPVGGTNYRSQITENTLNTSVLNRDILASNFQYENIINDRQILSQLDEKDIEIIVDRFNFVQ